MAAQSQLIIKRYDSFGGKFVDSQYLAAAYETGKPEMIEGRLMRVFSSSSRFFTGKLVLNMTGGKAGGTKEIDNWIYRWPLQGADYKSARLLENLESGNPTPGLNNTTFKFKLDLDIYANPDVLFGTDNEYPIAIMDGPIYDGGGSIYTGKIQGDNPNVFLPSDVLTVGNEFNKVWTSIQQEFNEVRGGTQFPNSFLLESQLGSFGQQYTVTDEAWRTEGKLGVEFMYQDRNGKDVVAKSFLPMAEAKMWDELYQSMEVQLIYGKKQTQPGKQGYWINILVPSTSNRSRKICLIAGNS